MRGMWRRLVQRLARRATLRRIDVDDEIRLHLELRVQRLIEGGLTPEEAERMALKRFGSLARSRRVLVRAARIRDRRLVIGGSLRLLLQELPAAWRSARRSPGIGIAMTLTIALGLGTNATMYAVIGRLLFEPPPHVADPDGLVELAHMSAAERLPGRSFSYPTFKAFQQTSAGLQQFAASSLPQEIALVDGPRSITVYALFVTSEYFAVLGARPAHGRFFTASDFSEPFGPQLTVISHALWRRHFNADPMLPGRTVDLGRGRYTVIGVAPEGFRGTGLTAIGAWIPLTAGEPFRSAGPAWHQDGRSTWLRVFARANPSFSPQATASLLTAAYRASLSHVPDGERLKRAVIVRRITTNERTFGELVDLAVPRLVVGVSLLVLLLAAVNVLLILIARATDRQRQTAVERALGASRARLVVRATVESLLLCGIAGGVTVLLVGWTGEIVQRVLFHGFGEGAFSIDAAVLRYVGLVALAVAVPVGIAAGVDAARPDVLKVLKSTGPQGARSRVRRVLVGTQAAVSAALLAGTGLFVHSLHEVQKVPLGFEPARVLFARANLRAAGYQPMDAKQIYEEMESRLRAASGIDAASLALTVPFWSTFGAGIEGGTAPGAAAPASSYLNAVGTEYFRTMGLQILRGRAFDDHDSHRARPVAIVNEALAARYWAGAHPLGDCVRLSIREGCVEIVGVAVNAVQESVTGGPPALQLYIPHAQAPVSFGSRVLVVRPSGDLERAIPIVRAVMQSVAPRVPAPDVRTFDQIPDIAGEMRPWRLGSAMFATFGSLALLLSAAGLYGVVASSAARRTREMGIRVALGARRSHIARLVLSDALVPVLTGGFAGLLGAALAAGRLQTLLFRTSPRDPVVFAGVVVVLVAVAALSAAVPARRAMRVDPAVTLRAG